MRSAIRVITWNIRHGGGARTTRVFGVLRSLVPDFVVLTEFRSNKNGTEMQRLLREEGLGSQCHPDCSSRKNSVLVAARGECTFETFSPELGVHAHRCVSARTHGLHIVGVYFALNREKRPLFDFLLSRSRSLLEEPAMIVGDFNTGVHRIDETGTTFSEANRFDDLARAGWVDVWRRLNAPKREYSWSSNKGNGFRIDHALCSPRLAGSVVSARYEHAYRDQGISDHSPLVVEFCGSR